MALTPTVLNSLGGTLVVSNTLAPRLNASLAGVLAVGNFPTRFMYAGEVGAMVTTTFLAGELEVSQVGALVVGRGRIDNPKLRAWTFTLDGHDFYVLRLGDSGSLVYDTYSGQWTEWTSPDLPFWRANNGNNWTGGQKLSPNFGSDVLVGDDVHGLLYFLDPEQPYDQTPLDYAEQQETYFERVVMGQVPARGRQPIECNVVYLTTDLGAPAFTGAGVTLFTSDDAGNSFTDQGAVTVVAGDYSQELSWRSLGDITAPGRLFKIVDTGAVTRIDGLEMNDAG
jgi:hypothetical protein